MSKREDKNRSKRQKFEQSGGFPFHKVAVIAIVLVVLVGGGLIGLRTLNKTKQAGGDVLASTGVNYDGTQEMVLLASAKVDGDKVTVDVNEVKEKKLGSFVYSRTAPMPAGYDDIGNNGLPLLAYVAPSGKLVVASSLCEPCRSYEFHTEGNVLVCNTCGTRWDLNTLDGVAGGCLGYPPEELEARVEGGQVVIDRSVLEAWTARV